MGDFRSSPKGQRGLRAAIDLFFLMKKTVIFQNLIYIGFVGFSDIQLFLKTNTKHNNQLPRQKTSPPQPKVYSGFYIVVVIRMKSTVSCDFYILNIIVSQGKILMTIFHKKSAESR